MAKTKTAKAPARKGTKKVTKKVTKKTAKKATMTVKAVAKKPKRIKLTPAQKKVIMAGFTPKPGIDILKRGKEFVGLLAQGLRQKDIETLYRKHGISFSNPTYFNARRIYEAPAYVREAIDSGKVVASSILDLLQGRKRLGEKKWEARLKEGIAKAIARRADKAVSLKEAGLIDDDVNQVKMTKVRTVRMVGDSLAKVRGGLKGTRAKAVAEFLRGLEEGLTAKELLTELGVKVPA